jgi:hypothetical protein
MARRILHLLLVLTFGSALIAATPLDARAQSDPVTITVGETGTLKSRIVATVPAQITCGPLDVYIVQQAATIEQAAGQEIARGNGFADQPIVCDGTPQPNSFTFLADSSGPPFHGGDAAVSIGLYICSTTFFCISGSSGIQIVRLTGSPAA